MAVVVSVTARFGRAGHWHEVMLSAVRRVQAYPTSTTGVSLRVPGSVAPPFATQSPALTPARESGDVRRSAGAPQRARTAVDAARRPQWLRGGAVEGPSAGQSACWDLVTEDLASPALHDSPVVGRQPPSSGQHGPRVQRAASGRRSGARAVVNPARSAPHGRRPVGAPAPTMRTGGGHPRCVILLPTLACGSAAWRMVGAACPRRRAVVAHRTDRSDVGPPSPLSLFNGARGRAPHTKVPSGGFRFSHEGHKSAPGVAPGSSLVGRRHPDKLSDVWRGAGGLRPAREGNLGQAIILPICEAPRGPLAALSPSSPQDGKQNVTIFTTPGVPRAQRGTRTHWEKTKSGRETRNGWIEQLLLWPARAA